jgi:hypothetical protein
VEWSKWRKFDGATDRSDIVGIGPHRFGAKHIFIFQQGNDLKHFNTALTLAVALSCSSAFADNHAKAGYPTRVFWGDTHLHTSNSFDVYLFGTPNSTPDAAYRFAKGLPVISPTTGTRWQIQQPLDFLVVADHAEMVGSVPRLFEENAEEFANTKTGKAMLKLAPDKSEEGLQKIYDAINYVASGLENELGVDAEQMVKDMHGGTKRETTWERNIETAEEHNEPGKFSAIIGFEWSSNAGGANLHRVVFQAEGGDVAKQYLPYSSLESDDPENLWKWLDATSEKTGATFVAIPHNPNISLSRMFPTERNNGKPVDAAYAKTRAEWEPVVEATQIKGDSESHPLLSPNDEFADYEIFDFALTPDGTRPKPTKADYIRNGLMRGLEFEKKLGTNPYKVGMIGATDSHTGMPAVEETNFSGKGQHDATAEQRPHPTGIGSSKGWDMGAAGYAGVWATENTREAIVAAFKRREVYATSGPRMTLRFFGGFDFTEDLAKSNSLVAMGYEQGVPMGGDLTAAPDDKAPTFLVAASKDPNGANLDRIQIIKGYLNEEGFAEERIYDVAVSDDRKIGKDGRCETPVGNTVDLNTGKYTNTIGDVQMTVTWTDPDFDPEQAAFYYVRLLEIPTPRYSLLDAIALGIDWKETNRPATIQERCYSSPIWYTPAE